MEFTFCLDKEVSRNHYYTNAKFVKVEIPDEKMPHHLRVWLIDRTTDFAKGFSPVRMPPTVVEPTFDDVMEYLEGAYFESDPDKDRKCAEINERVAADPMEFIRRWDMPRYSSSGAMAEGMMPYMLDGVDRGDSRIAQSVAIVDAMVEKRREEQKAECVRLKEIADAEAVALAAERAELESIRNAAVVLAVQASGDAVEIQRLKDGFMSEAHQRDYLRLCLIPDKGFEKIAKENTRCPVCTCGTLDFEEKCADTLSKDRFVGLMAIKNAYPDLKVLPVRREIACDTCECKKTVFAALVSGVIGDWELNRRFEL